jgi:hypothetical protein
MINEFSKDDEQIYRNQFSQKIEKAYNTPGSQVVSHPSTRKACRSLTSQIGRDAVHSPKYGRKRKKLCIV